MQSGLDKIFKPNAIAVVGASSKRGSIGHVILNNILRFNYQGNTYAVNPRADAVGVMKCYKSVLELPEKPDLAVIVVPREFVAQALDECGRMGIGGAVVITSGFKEVGGEGVNHEAEIVSIAQKYGMRIIGPNCYGIINTAPAVSFNGTFSKLNPLPGKVAFLSQSGALGEVVLDYTNRLHLGISMFVSIGNKADISDIEVLQYWRDDPNTEVILIYIENIDNASEFRRVTSEIARRKPIIAVKAGRTESGARAISSHTGVLAGGDTGIDAFFEKCGILRAMSMEELFDIAMAFSNQPLPKGDRVAVITNAGGPGIMATDALESLGLEMARFEKFTIDTLRSKLPPMAAVGNPIDVIASGGPEAYAAAVEAALADANVDSLLVIFVPPILVDHKAVINAIIEKIEAASERKTVLACLMGSPSGIAGTEDLIAHDIPVYGFPEGAARALAGMSAYRKWRNKPEGKVIQFKADKGRVKKIIDASRRSGRRAIMGPEGLAILDAYGINIPASASVANESRIDEALESLHLPVAMKIDDQLIIHKSDIGGVALKLRTRQEVLEAFRRMKAKFARADQAFAGVMIQEMAGDGIETIIGMNQDSILGALLMFGLGGISVETMKDVAFKVHPLTDLDAGEMIMAIKGYRLLTGFRGAPPADIETLEETLLRLSQLVTDFPHFESLDVNPFIVMPAGQESLAVDARFILKE